MATRNTDSRAMAARQSAVAALIAAHKEEFDQLVGDAREKAGLPRDKNEYLKQQRIDRHIKALKELGVEVPSL